MKKIRRNERGTVLLTVLCFTTMCLVIAAIALKVSTTSNKQSTENVKRAQAQVTAEQYLEQFLEVDYFPVDPKTGQQNFDNIKKLAGTSEENATAITITLQQSGGTGPINMSVENYDDNDMVAHGTTAAYGGACTIYVYKSGSTGYVVKSVANYGGETGQASAYFYGVAPSTDLNKNAIETCGVYNVDNTATISGDLLVEQKNPATAVLRFRNNNGVYASNIYTNGNICDNKEDVEIVDTVQKNAPTLTAGGHMYLSQTVMYTDVGKTDINKNNKVKIYDNTKSYDKDHLLNKNGYINCDKKIIFTGNNLKTTIGKNNLPIDIYCRGMIVGKMPTGSYGTTTGKYPETISSADATKFVNDIGTLFNASSDIANCGGVNEPTIYGNVYCYRRLDDDSNDVSTIDDDGDLIINLSGHTQTINGDLAVDGNIYILGGSLKVTGTIWCTGTINIVGSVSADKGIIYDKLPTDERATKPDMNYAPGIYNPGVKENPTISKPSSYKSTNEMYADNSEKSKYFKQHFQNALSKTLSDSWGTTRICPEYTGAGSLENVDRDTLLGKTFNINKSVRLTRAQVEKEGANFQVNVQDEDIWVLLPATQAHNGKYEDIVHSQWWTEHKQVLAPEDAINQRAKFRVSNPGTKHHCYFVFYQWSDSADYTSTAGKTYASAFYERDVNANPYGNSASDYPSGYVNDKDVIRVPTYQMSPYKDKNVVGVSTTDFCPGFNSPSGGDYEPANATEITTNIIYLIPDGARIKLGTTAGQYSSFHAVFYGPKSYLWNPINIGSKVYGQVKVSDYDVLGGLDGAANKDQCADFAELEGDSILHAFLTDATGNAGALNFQYYIRHK